MNTLYFATLCAGFEEVVSAEVAWRLPGAVVRATEPGKVFFESAHAPRDVLALRSVNHIHVVAAQYEGFSPDRAELARMEGLAAATDLATGAALLAGISPPTAGPPRFRVTAHRSGEHDYRSPEVAAAIGAGVVAGYGWPVSLREHDIEVVAYQTDDRLLLGIRLTTEGSLHRRNRVGTGHTTLKASVAYSLAWLADPAHGTVLLDPACGAGTIPIEAVLGWPHLTALGGDISANELALARRNAQFAEAPVGLARWDARALPLAAESLDRVVSDLPFGRRTGTHTSNRHLYPGLIRELVRVLRPGGRAVLYTTERRLMQSVLHRTPGLKLERTVATILSNLRPCAYLLRRA